MVITVQRGNVVLADGDSATWTGGVLTRGLPFEATREMEVIPLLEAAGVSVFDRTTGQASVEFTITRLHADEGAAAAFCATHDALATGKADLRFILDVNGVIYTLQCKGAAWKAITCDPVGQSTDTDYRVTGPPFTATSSAGPTGYYLDGGDGYDPAYGPAPGVVDGGEYGDNGVPEAVAAQSPTYA
jgi:hypothetical protein